MGGMSKRSSTKASTKTQVAPAAPEVHKGMTREMIEERKAILRDLMIKNPTMGCQNLAAALGVSRSSIRRIYDALRKQLPGTVKYNGNQYSRASGQPLGDKVKPSAFPNLSSLGFSAAAAPAKPMPLGEKEQLEARMDALRQEVKEEQKKTDYWKTESQKKDAEIEQYLATWDHTLYAYKIPMSRGSDNSETIPVLLCSDWHCEEPVHPRTVLGANEFSLEIAHESITTLTKTALRLINLKRAGTKINKMVLWLGGDFITGHIHDENKSLCTLPPVEAIMWAEDRIYSMIEFFLQNGDFEQIVIPCSCGNHARTTQRKNIAQQSQTSYEWGMYNHLSREYKNNPRIKFVLNPGLFCTVELFEQYKLRLHHGDAIRYKDGVGGLTIPLNKRIAKWNENGREVYMDCMGHWHTYMPGRKAIVNGSVIGYNAFAQECGFAVEPPEQTLFFVEKKHGLTSIEPIFVRG